MIGSIFATTAHQERREVQEALGRKVVLAESPAGMNEDVFVSYRPWLDMRVVTFSLSTNEWGLKAGWRLELEEI
jgi:hypothetical protein